MVVNLRIGEIFLKGSNKIKRFNIINFGFQRWNVCQERDVRIYFFVIMVGVVLKDNDEWGEVFSWIYNFLKFRLCSQLIEVIYSKDYWLNSKEQRIKD